MSQKSLVRARGIFGNGRVGGGSSSDRFGVGRARRGSARRLSSSWGGRVEPLEPRIVLAGDLFISEIMASNDSSLNDEDDESPDWLEVTNMSNNMLDLDGWSLTDDSTDLTKWQFPSVDVAAGESVIVFASGKDRSVAGAELHTNFRLSSGGEFLALVQSDGTTIEDSYTPFPEQFTDVSYGPQQEIITHELSTGEVSSRVLLPSSAAEDVAASTWTALNFDDSGWMPTEGGVGYDLDVVDGDFAALIGAEGDLTAMHGTTSSVYMRTSFQIDGDQVPDLTTMTLTTNYDDGYVAYLNGTEIASRRAPETLAWDSVATEEYGGVLEQREPNFNDVDDQTQFMLGGDAKWFFGRLQLTPSTPDQVGSAWTTNALPFGSEYSFSTSMVMDIYDRKGSSRAQNGGLTFVVQAGGNTRLGSGGGSLGLEDTGMAFVAIEFDSDDDGAFDEGEDLSQHVGINTSVDGSLARVEVDRFNRGSAGQNLRYVWIDYNGVTNQLDVYFTDSDAKPDTPTVSASVELEDLFSGVPELWVGWTASTGVQSNAHDVLSWQFTSGAGQLGLEQTHDDVSRFIELLQPGQNVLAIHGLNIAVDDEDFLLRPQLTATETVLTEEKYFVDPTPGDANGLGSLPPSVGTSISVDSRLFVDPFMVEIQADSPGVEVRYTTDGSLPEETSTLYTGPIEITESSRIRSRAFEENRAPGPVSSAGYTLLSEELVSFENGQPFESNLPLMIFESFNPDRRDKVDRNDRRLVPVSGVFIDTGEDGRASILDEPTYAGRAGLRIRGQSSQGWPKKQYALEIWDEGNSDAAPIEAKFADDKNIPLFGLPAESDWVLNAPYSDKTQLNNYLSFNWGTEIGLESPGTRLVEVFVNDDGGPLDMSTDYRGTYVLLEKIKIDENRLDVPELTRADNSEPEITGGYIWKKDKAGAGDEPFTTAINRQLLRHVEPKDGDITDEQTAWLTNHINEFEAALNGPDFADPELGYAKYIDVDSWIDTWIMVEMTKQIDGFRLSTYYFKDRGGKIEQGPLWDFNLALGNANYLRGAYADGWYGLTINTDQYPYWERLFEDPNFEQRLADRWQELRQTTFTTENIQADIDAAVDLISDGNPNLDQPAEGEPSNPISRNVEHWNRLDRDYLTRYHWPNCYYGIDDCPPSPLISPDNPSGTPTTYADFIFLMKNFMDERLAWMDSQFVAQPTVSPVGGEVLPQTLVTFEASQGTVLYTTNGRDPREFVTGVPRDVFLPAGSQADILTPNVLDGFANTIVQACTGALANPDNCLMSPNYTLGTHGETWTSDPLPMGFDDRTNFTDLIATDLQSRMDNLNTTAYARIPFELTAEQIEKAVEVSLQIRYDDGFVAYLWSDEMNLPVEIARANVPGDPQTIPITPLAFNDEAQRSHRNDEAVEFQGFDITDALQYMRDGTNYLVIHGLNSSPTSHDFLIDVQVVAKRSLTDLPDGLFEYTDAIAIDANTRIFARAFDEPTEQWSGPVSATYIVEQPTLAITELNYNPYPPTDAEAAAGIDNSDDFEFLEIQNVGAQTNLIGTRFSQGIEFEFPSMELAPEQYGVIVRNQAAFQMRYGTDVPVLGEYSGNLSNAGEVVTMVSATGNVLARFEYGDNRLWPQSADGIGATLQSTGPSGEYFHWRGSTEFGGSPGRAGSSAVGIVVNEVLANTNAPQPRSDAIELLNTTSAPVNASGWYVSDSRDNLFKYQIPDNTTIGAGEYFVIVETQFNPDGKESGFALSGSRGDDVWVVIPDGQGGIASFVDDIHFGSTASGESLGRVPNGTGLLAPMSETTLGRENAAPRVGPIVISEINYHPALPSTGAVAIDTELTRDDLEYIEIHNPTADSLNLTNWRIAGGVDFDFVTGTTLAPNESLLVVSFDPTAPDNANRLAAFRAQFAVGDGVKLVGGFKGQLSNRGERVQLQRPDAPPADDPSYVPRLLEDEAVYDDQSPWPTDADGLGKTLTRSNLSGWGNSPLSWTAANPTPGSIQAFVPQAGDANMDRQFDQKDIVVVLQAGKFLTAQPATFAEGDWNGDGVFDQLDIVASLRTGNYLQGPYAGLMSKSADTSRTDHDAVDDFFRLLDY